MCVATTDVQPSGSEKRVGMSSLTRRANTAQVRGLYDKAESFFRQALALAHDGQIAGLLNNLAMVHKYQGRFSEASLLYRRALRIIVRTVGPDHPDVATLYH